MREDDFLTLESSVCERFGGHHRRGSDSTQAERKIVPSTKSSIHTATEERYEDEDRAEKYQKRTNTGANELADEPHEQPDDATNSALLGACPPLCESTRTPVTAASQ